MIKRIIIYLIIAIVVFTTTFLVLTGDTNDKKNLLNEQDYEDKIREIEEQNEIKENEEQENEKEIEIKENEEEIELVKIENCQTKTENHIYYVCTCEDLQNTEYENGRNITLLQDIDCTDTVNWNNGKGWAPLGNTTKQYKGTLDGKGHTIYNLYIDRPNENQIGLIGFADNGTTIQNLKINNAQITGNKSVSSIVGHSIGVTIKNVDVINSEITAKDTSVGGVLGSGVAGGTINLISVSNAKINAKIVSENNVVGGTGGIIGNTSGKVTIFKSEFDGEVIGYGNTGGVVGMINSNNNNNTLISEIKINGNIKGTINVGGSSGYSINVEHNRIQSFAKIECIENGGGISGNSNKDIIKNSFFKGEIKGIENIGGLIGQSKNHRSIKDSYTLAKIEGNAVVGGVIGSMSFGEIRPGMERIYVASTIIANEEYDAFFPRETNPLNPLDSFVDVEVSGNTWLARNGFVEEKTTLEMMSRETFLKWRLNSQWQPVTGSDYPKLSYE